MTSPGPLSGVSGAMDSCSKASCTSSLWGEPVSAPPFSVSAFLCRHREIGWVQYSKKSIAPQLNRALGDPDVTIASCDIPEQAKGKMVM